MKPYQSALTCFIKTTFGYLENIYLHIKPKQRIEGGWNSWDIEGKRAVRLENLSQESAYGISRVCG